MPPDDDVSSWKHWAFDMMLHGKPLDNVRNEPVRYPPEVRKRIEDAIWTRTPTWITGFRV